MLPMNFGDKNVCVVGLGYVGLTLAVAMADVGFRIFGVERDPRVLKALGNGCAHFSEVGLDMRLAKQLAGKNLSFAPEVDAEDHATVYIVTVGTPIGPDRRTRFDAIKLVTEAIGGVLKDDDVVILRSTVRVGTTREIVKPILDQAGKRYCLAFCPERTLEGKAMVELRALPQVVGGVDNLSTFRASQLFSFLTPSVVRVRDLETAEMVKLINNTQRDFIFAFANEVAAMCDAVGVSATEVIASGNLGYPRANVPMPGPVGGPCLEKDPYILAEGLERFGFTPSLSLAARRWNENLPAWTIGQLARDYADVSRESPKRVGILGLAFKGRPETNDLRGTLAIPIIEMLRGEFPSAEIVGWDPLVTEEEAATLHITPAPSLESVFHDASIVVIQNNHERFARMNLAELSSTMLKPGIIYDYWNQHEVGNVELMDGVLYQGLGAANVKADRSKGRIGPASAC
jgi:UDP-N-acetyl-D-mannosaminuronic acid dehydrogenase